MMYVRREANQIAHKLARMASTSSQVMDSLWNFYFPPDCIAETIIAEQSAMFV
jgi:hypothetical protein